MLSRLFCQDIGVDLGSSRTRIYVYGKGIEINQPSAVAAKFSHSDDNNQIIARKMRCTILSCGDDAIKMLGRTAAEARMIYPVEQGGVSDLKACLAMLKAFYRQGGISHSLLKNRIWVSAPSESNEIEKRAIEDIFKSMGASQVRFVPHSMASAIGAMLPVDKPTASMAVDIGAGKTDTCIAVFGGVAICRSRKVGSLDFDREITEYIRRDQNIQIGASMAEKIKWQIGSLDEKDKGNIMKICGRGIDSGMPQECIMGSSALREAVKKAADGIVRVIRETLEQAPCELVGDLYGSEIMLTGGGAMLKGLDKYLSEKLGMKFTVALDPQNCCIYGIREAIDTFNGGKPQLMDMTTDLSEQME